jgi:hypothetical protein
MLIENAAGINAKRLAEAHETNSRLISRLRLKSFLDAARKPDKGAGMLESKKKRVGEPTRFVLCEIDLPLSMRRRVSDELSQPQQEQVQEG